LQAELFALLHLNVGRGHIVAQASDADFL
jgi:hypothetical protein